MNQAHTEVVAAGLGQTPVGEHWEVSLRELAAEAILAALKDAGGLRPQVVYIGNMLAVSASRQANLGALLVEDAGLQGVEGVTVEPTNAQTNSQVHYLNENEDGFNQDATGSKGLFLIVNPGLVEGFEAFRGDTRINAYTAKVGAASGAVFSVTMPVYLDDDPKP